MEYFDNPVGRLYLLLDQIRMLPNSEAKKRMREIWARIFEIDVLDTEELFLAYIEMLRLLKTAREETERLPNIEPDLYLKPFERLERAFTVNSFEHQLQNFKQYLDPATMTALKFCAHTLSQVYEEPDIDENIIHELRSEIEALIDEVVGSTDIEYELRVFLIERLEEIRRALLYYRINGVKGLRKALESTIGAMYLFNKVDAVETTEGSKLQRIGKQMQDILFEIAKLVVVEKAKELLGGVLPMLPGV